MQDRPTGTMVRCSKARAMFAMRACRRSVMVGKALDKTRMTAVRCSSLLSSDLHLLTVHPYCSLDGTVAPRDLHTTRSCDTWERWTNPGTAHMVGRRCGIFRT